MDIILVSPLALHCEEYMECMNERIYYIAQGDLYFVWEKDILKDGEAKNTICAQTHGKVVSMFAFCGAVFVVIDDGFDVSLYKFDGNKFVLIRTGFFGKTTHYFVTKDKKYVIFFEYQSREDGKTRFYIIDQKSSICEYICNEECTHFHNITIYKKHIYIAIGDHPHKIISTNFKALLRQSSGSSINFSTMKNASCYNFIHNGDELLFAENGCTRTTHLDGRTYFQDVEEGKSGFQIAAQSCQSLNVDYQLLGTWRRSTKHPYACFYVLQNGKTLLKYTDSIHVNDSAPWTGYTCYNSSTAHSRKFVFSNMHSAPLLVRTYTSYADFYNDAGKEHISIKYIGKNVMIAFNESKNTAATSSPCPAVLMPIKAKKHYFYDNARTCNVYITIDVEQHLKNIPFCITGEGLETECGVYFIMNTLEKYGLKGVFFVNVYEHQNYSGLMERIIADMHTRGHEVALHWHKSDLDFNNKNHSTYNYEEQKFILEYGKNFIENVIQDKVWSFRGGGYCLSETTLCVLADIGIRVDSSVFMANVQSVKHKTKNKICRYGNLIEVPVTTHALDGGLSKIDINWNKTARNMLEIINTCRHSGIKNIVAMLHSFSFVEFTADKQQGKKNLEFTAGRFARGVNAGLMREFEIFCEKLSQMACYNVTTFKNAYENGDFESSLGTDIVPFRRVTDDMNGFCPVCGNSVEFAPYRDREHALCPVCSSLERMRFKMLYLKNILNIENCGYKSVLHLGPAANIQQFLKQQTHIDYISSDPFSPADMKFKIEDIPFSDNTFDIILCSGVMMHVLDDEKGFSEMYRVLKNNGELVLWLGSCEMPTTKEYYDKSLYHKMIVGNTVTPKDVFAPVIEERNGVLYYNPRYATRVYGKDVFKKLADIGFTVNVISATHFENYKLCGIPHHDMLLSCRKNQTL